MSANQIPESMLMNLSRQFSPTDFQLTYEIVRPINKKGSSIPFVDNDIITWEVGGDINSFLIPQYAKVGYIRTVNQDITVNYINPATRPSNDAEGGNLINTVVRSMARYPKWGATAYDNCSLNVDTLGIQNISRRLAIFVNNKLLCSPNASKFTGGAPFGPNEVLTLDNNRLITLVDGIPAPGNGALFVQGASSGSDSNSFISGTELQIRVNTNTYNGIRTNQRYPANVYHANFFSIEGEPHDAGCRDLYERSEALTGVVNVQDNGVTQLSFKFNGNGYAQCDDLSLYFDIFNSDKYIPLGFLSQSRKALSFNMSVASVNRSCVRLNPIPQATATLAVVENFAENRVFDPVLILPIVKIKNTELMNNLISQFNGEIVPVAPNLNVPLSMEIPYIAYFFQNDTLPQGTLSSTLKYNLSTASVRGMWVQFNSRSYEPNMIIGATQQTDYETYQNNSDIKIKSLQVTYGSNVLPLIPASDLITQGYDPTDHMDTANRRGDFSRIYTMANYKMTRHMFSPYRPRPSDNSPLAELLARSYSVRPITTITGMASKIEGPILYFMSFETIPPNYSDNDGDAYTRKSRGINTMVTGGEIDLLVEFGNPAVTSDVLVDSCMAYDAVLSVGRGVIQRSEKNLLQ